MSLPRRNLLSAIASASLSAAPIPAFAQSDSQPTTLDLLKDRIDVARVSVGMIAMTLADGRRELVTWGKSGTADDRPLGGDTVFEAGSITKVFTALLLADMVTRGEVSFDDPVAALLPAGTIVPERGKKITLLDLATYTSGLPNLPRPFKTADDDDPYADYGADKLLAFLAAHTPEHEPGTHYEYANMGFALLGHALSVRAGKPYETLMLERICAPLGMADTRITLSPSMQARSVQGHDSNLRPVPDWHFQVFAGAGALHSTANDLAAFVEAAMGQRPSSLDKAFALLLATRRPALPPNLDVGLGWFVLKAPGGEIVFKDGGTAGTRSFIGFSPKAGRGAVLMSNVGWRVNINDIGLHLVDPAVPVRRLNAAIALPPAELDRVVGFYRFERFTLGVREQGGRLFAQLTNQPEFEIFASAATEFFYRIVDAQLSFELGPDGRAAAVVLHQNKRDIRGERQ